jgi:2-keto-3-deoxy-L-rhamnonate aldolase RhmA
LITISLPPRKGKNARKQTLQNIIMYANNLLEAVRANRLCKSFGIKISTNGQVVQIAHNAGFDCLFIDLEHGWLSVAEAANLCHVGLLVGITPFVRVPHQCGNGFVQRVLDGGAMGVIFPHVESAGINSPSTFIGA